MALGQLEIGRFHKGGLCASCFRKGRFEATSPASGVSSSGDLSGPLIADDSLGSAVTLVSEEFRSVAIAQEISAHYQENEFRAKTKNSTQLPLQLAAIVGL